MLKTALNLHHTGTKSFLALHGRIVNISALACKLFECESGLPVCFGVGIEHGLLLACHSENQIRICDEIAMAFKVSRNEFLAVDMDVVLLQDERVE